MGNRPPLWPFNLLSSECVLHSVGAKEKWHHPPFDWFRCRGLAFTWLLRPPRGWIFHRKKMTVQFAAPKTFVSPCRTKTGRGIVLHGLYPRVSVGKVIVSNSTLQMKKNKADGEDKERDHRNLFLRPYVSPHHVRKACRLRPGVYSALIIAPRPVSLSHLNSNCFCSGREPCCWCCFHCNHGGNNIVI